MTPERQIYLTALAPTLADFQRIGPVVHVNVRLKPGTDGSTTGARYENLTYELRMFLDGFATWNGRIGDLPAPQPLRHYEIVCEDTVLSSGAY